LYSNGIPLDDKMTEKGDQKSTEKQFLEQTHNDTWYLTTVQKKNITGSSITQSSIIDRLSFHSWKSRKKLVKTVPHPPMFVASTVCGTIEFNS
jgi:hypothetical protein